MRANNFGLAACLVLVVGGASAQVDPALVGRWTAIDKHSLDIRPSALRFRYQSCDGGECHPAQIQCRWSPAADQVRNTGDGSCHFGQMKSAKSRDDLIREADAELRQQVKEKSAEVYVGPVRAGKKVLQSTMRPVPLQHFIINESGDIIDFYYDGEHLFKVAPYGVMVFTRVGKSPAPSRGSYAKPGQRFI